MTASVILEPQKFENKEVGVKWNIKPRLQYTAAVYELEPDQCPIPDPNNVGFFILSGATRVRGFETALNGNVTDDWQSTLGYAYTDARMSRTDARRRLLPATTCNSCRSINSRGGTNISYPDVGRCHWRHLLLRFLCDLG